MKKIFILLIFSAKLLLAQNIIVDEDSLIAKPQNTKPVKSKIPQPKSSPKSKPSPKPKPTVNAQPPVKSQPATKSPPPTVTSPTSIPPLSEEDLKEPLIETKEKEVIMEPEGASVPSSTTANPLDKPKYKNRKALTLDYNTWYEMLLIRDKVNSSYGESKSHYFGVGLYYDYTIYEEKYGYAFSLGAITGNAQTGTINTAEYYERRTPWLGYRAAGRLFVRVNNRIDIGPALIIQYKETKWKEETEFKVMPQTNPQYFMYLDTRWRISYPLELIQSFGFHTRQYSMIWRLGINYTLN